MLKPSPTGDEVAAGPDVSPRSSQCSAPQDSVPHSFKAKVTEMMMATISQLESEHQRQLQQMEEQIQQRLLKMGYKDAAADLLASEESEGLPETQSGGALGSSKSGTVMKQDDYIRQSRPVLHHDESMVSAINFKLLMEWESEASDLNITDTSVGEIQLQSMNWLTENENGQEVPVGASKCVMHPSSHFRMAWDLLGALALIYDLCVIPLAVFDVPEDRALFVMSVIIMMFWTVDLIGNFFVGHYTQTGALELRWSRVVRRYCSKWFLPDLIIVSVDWVSYGRELFTRSSSDGASVGGAARLVRLGKAARFFRMVRVLRLVRIGKLQAIGQRFSDLFGLETSVIAFSLFKNLLLIMYVNHVIACGWFWIGMIHEDEGWLAGRGKQGGEAWQDSYFLCLFWAIANFTPGSSGIAPVTLEEHIYTCSVLFFALVVFTVLVSATTSLVSRLMSIQSARKHQLWLLRGFLHQHKISHELRERVLRYLQAAIGHHAVIHKNEVQLLNTLSQPLREEVQLSLHLATLRGHPFLTALASASRPLIRKISNEALVEVQYSRGDTTFSLGEEQADMGFALSGVLKYRAAAGEQPSTGMGKEASDSSSSVLLQSGDFYCEAALWTKWHARGTMQADVDVDVLCLRSSGFADAVSKQPMFLHMVREYARAFVDVLNFIVSGQLSLPLNDLQACYLVQGEPIQNVLASLTLQRNRRYRSGE